MWQLQYVDKHSDTIDDWREKFGRLVDNFEDVKTKLGYPFDYLAHVDNPETFIDDQGEPFTVSGDPTSVAEALGMTKSESERLSREIKDSTVIKNFDYDSIGTVVEYLNDIKLLLEQETGYLEDLTTGDSTDIRSALDWLKTEIYGANTIDPSETVVGLINQADAKVGDIHISQTQLKKIVKMINYPVDMIGHLPDLLTTTQTDVISAINELVVLLNSAFDARNVNRFKIDGLDSTKSETVVGKINALVKYYGLVSTLKTDAKVLSSSINEIHDELGTSRDITSASYNSTFVEALKDIHNWRTTKKQTGTINYFDDVHVLTADSSLASQTTESYQYWYISGTLSTTTKTFTTRETQNYKVWTKRGKYKTRTVKEKDGQYVLRNIPITKTTFTKNYTTLGKWYQWRNFWTYLSVNAGEYEKEKKKPRSSRLCIGNDSFAWTYNNWWTAYQNIGWNGPTGSGGFGVDKQARHYIGFEDIANTGLDSNGHPDDECSWFTTNTVTKNVSYLQMKRWADKTTRERRTYWADNSRFENAKIVVGTQHTKTVNVWTDESFWEDGTRKVWSTNLPHKGLFIEGIAKALTFQGKLVGNVTGDVTGDARGNAYPSGTAVGSCSNWRFTRRFEFSGDIGNFGTTINGAADRTINITGHQYSPEVHNHEDRGYWKVIDANKDLLYCTVSYTSSSTTAFNLVSALYSGMTNEVIDSSWLSQAPNGTILVVKAGTDSQHYTHAWIRSNTGWDHISTTYNSTVISGW